MRVWLLVWAHCRLSSILRQPSIMGNRLFPSNIGGCFMVNRATRGNPERGMLLVANIGLRLPESRGLRLWHTPMMWLF